MRKEREDTRIYKWKPLAYRSRGRQKNKWEDEVTKELQTMKINPLTPELNPPAQRCLTRIFIGDFAS
jgi:hypothetical protein